MKVIINLIINRNWFQNLDFQSLIWVENNNKDKVKYVA